ncbi:B-cell antigen receptor complex-associated protein alpha chain [Hemiscyllium ocellatum]|uniref:B-cell antigen receptor complex-associated protein alpha chain n=1 Tax=Hemiscyllium ocellatum TaxID=170820 RepID=UPI00296695C1|nr:B-cell antigen receptor complex-associated protein alpha chain [Hemiscyllium ocellatum]
MASRAACALALLVMARVEPVGALTIPTPSVLAELGSSFQLQCNVSGREVTWQMRSYNSAIWHDLDSKEAQYHWEKVEPTDLGIYRCHNNQTRETSCNVGLRVYGPRYSKFFNIKESKKNLILMVEGILLLSLVVIPGTILLREKSQRVLKEKIQRYKEENENLYEGLNQAELSTYEDITRGQQSMYQDVANYRLSDSELEQP